MKWDDLKSARSILAYVAAHSGEVTWYNIVNHVDRLDVERDPPAFAVLKELAAQQCVATTPPEGGNQATYHLTDRGQELLQRLSGARAPE
jgi:DNA-binding PadR family transcriptional regulator